MKEKPGLDKSEAIAREKIHEAITGYYAAFMKDRRKFVPGKTKAQSSGAVFDQHEINAMLDAMLGVCPSNSFSQA
jgi:hypothetical protein